MKLGWAQLLISLSAFCLEIGESEGRLRKLARSGSHVARSLLTLSF